MTDQHPITPPPELVQEWKRTAPHQSNEHEHYHYITLCAAQWGADQELDACCDWLSTQSITDALCDYDLKPIADDLRAARRPKPPSLNKQALEALDEAIFMADDDPPEGICSDQADIIRRALERLKQLEDSND